MIEDDDAFLRKFFGLASSQDNARSAREEEARYGQDGTNQPPYKARMSKWIDKVYRKRLGLKDGDEREDS